MACFALQLHPSLAWRAQDVMEETAPDFAGTMNVLYLTTRSIEDALAESVTGEIGLFIGTCESPHARFRWFRFPPSGFLLVLVGASLFPFCLGLAFFPLRLEEVLLFLLSRPQAVDLQGTAKDEKQCVSILHTSQNCNLLLLSSMYVAS